jgi:hypothetical protein
MATTGRVTRRLRSEVARPRPQPAVVPPPGPSPFPAQPLLPVLDTSFNNTFFDTSSPTWASDIASGQTWLENETPRYEWTQVLNPTSEFDDDLVGLSGTAVSPEISEGDMPFTHPFGFDWEFYVAPDQPYLSLLAPSNAGRPGDDGEFINAVRHARDDLRLSVPKGVLGVEIDQGLVPEEYRAQDGDRVVVFGRWIVDCGHSDFHSEIHPPLLLVTARPVARGTDPDNPRPTRGLPDSTMAKIVGRPYLVSQEFGDGALRQHLINEAVKVFCPGFPFAALAGDCSLKVEAHPRFMPKPFSGLHLINFTVRPPSQRHRPTDRLIVSFHFTVRHGVVVQVINAGSDAVGVVIAMNDLSFTAPPLPPRQDWNISIDELTQLNPEAGSIYNDVILGAAAAAVTGLTNPAAPALLSTGILTDLYDAPQARSPHDSENVVLGLAADALAQNMGVSEDNNQPFPIYGWVNVGWLRDLTGVVTTHPTV